MKQSLYLVHPDGAGLRRMYSSRDVERGLVRRAGLAFPAIPRHIKDMRRAFACAATGVVLAGSSAARADRILIPAAANARMRACLLEAGAGRVVLHRRAATGDVWFATPRPSPLPSRRPMAADMEHAGWSIVYEMKSPHDVVGILSTDDGLAADDGAAFVRCTNAALR